MPQSKEVHAEYMRNKRKGSQKGSQDTKVHSKGSQDIEYIKTQLPSYIVSDIERIIKWFERLGSGIEPTERWGNAYKYWSRYV